MRQETFCCHINFITDYLLDSKYLFVWKRLKIFFFIKIKISIVGIILKKYKDCML